MYRKIKKLLETRQNRNVVLGLMHDRLEVLEQIHMVRRKLGTSADISELEEELRRIDNKILKWRVKK